MRISDWSSDVCSSDLFIDAGLADEGPDPRDAIVVPLRRSRARAVALLHLHAAEFQDVKQHVPRPIRSCLKKTGPGESSLIRIATTAISGARRIRSEEHTSELQSLMRISSAVFCLKK